MIISRDITGPGRMLHIESYVHEAGRPRVKRPRTAEQRAALGQKAAAERGQLQEWVTDLANWLVLLHHHEHDSRHGSKGLPDSVFVGTRVLWRELKTEWATLSPDQKTWGAALLDAGEDWDVWRPSDWFPSRDYPRGLIAAQLGAIVCRVPDSPRLVAK